MQLFHEQIDKSSDVNTIVNRDKYYNFPNLQNSNS